VAVDALQVGVDGRSDGGRPEILRGLGSLTLVRGAAAAVEQALQRWALVQPGGLDGTGPLAPLPAVAIPSAYLAVQQFGQSLDHRLDGLEAREKAENLQFLWDHTIGLVADLVQGRWGGPVGVVESVLAIGLGFDGTWENGIYRGLVFDRDDAVDAALAQLPPDRAADAEAVVDQSAAAYDRTARALGHPRPPTSPDVDYTEPATGGLQSLVQERMGGGGRRPR
jgi:hypothetical protein